MTYSIADMFDAEWDDREIPERDLLVCHNCGYEWNGGYIPAGPFEPHDYRHPDCPHCEAPVGEHDQRFDPDCEFCERLAERMALHA